MNTTSNIKFGFQICFCICGTTWKLLRNGRHDAVTRLLAAGRPLQKSGTTGALLLRTAPMDAVLAENSKKMKASLVDGEARPYNEEDHQLRTSLKRSMSLQNITARSSDESSSRNGAGFSSASSSTSSSSCEWEGAGAPPVNNVRAGDLLAGGAKKDPLLKRTTGGGVVLLQKTVSGVSTAASTTSSSAPSTSSSIIPPSLQKTASNASTCSGRLSNATGRLSNATTACSSSSRTLGSSRTTAPSCVSSQGYSSTAGAGPRASTSSSSSGPRQRQLLAAPVGGSYNSPVQEVALTAPVLSVVSSSPESTEDQVLPEEEEETVALSSTTETTDGCSSNSSRSPVSPVVPQTSEVDCGTRTTAGPPPKRFPGRHSLAKVDCSRGARRRGSREEVFHRAGDTIPNILLSDHAGGGNASTEQSSGGGGSADLHNTTYATPVSEEERPRRGRTAVF